MSTHAGVDVGKGKYLFTPGGSANWCILCGDSLKSKKYIDHWSSCIILGTHPKDFVSYCRNIRNI